MRTCGGINIVHALIQKDKEVSIIKDSALLLVLLSKTNGNIRFSFSVALHFTIKTLDSLCLLHLVENRDFFEPNGSKQLCDVLNSLIENLAQHSDTVLAGLSLARCVAKSENNKGNLPLCESTENVTSVEFIFVYIPVVKSYSVSCIYIPLQISAVMLTYHVCAIIYSYADAARHGRHPTSHSHLRGDA
jgi:hypothetical protein